MAPKSKPHNGSEAPKIGEVRRFDYVILEVKWKLCSALALSPVKAVRKLQSRAAEEVGCRAGVRAARVDPHSSCWAEPNRLADELYPCPRYP